MNEIGVKDISEPLKRLLFAALSDDASAVGFYKSWRENIDFDRISRTECELLPKVYESLQRVKFSDYLTPKIKGICRRTWLENQLYKSEITNFFGAFDGAAAEFILLTKEPLIYSLKNGETNFSFRDFRILSRRPVAPKTIENLERVGWRIAEKHRAQQSFDEGEIRFNHAAHLSVNVKIGNHIFNKDVWQSAETIVINGKEIKVLSSADFLLQTLVEEFLPSEKKIDGKWILFSALTFQNDEPTDWDRLARQSRKLRLNYALVEMLDEAVKYSASEDFSKSRYKFFDAPRSKPQRIFSAYRSLKKSYDRTGEKFSVIGFAGFLRRQWKADSLFELLRQTGKRFLKS